MDYDYPGRFDPAKRYQGLAFPGREFKAHSYDMNDFGAISRFQMKRIGDLIASDGQVMDDVVDIVIDPDTGLATISAAEVYIDGMVHDVGAATLTVPDTIEVSIGFRVYHRYITDDEDPELRGQIPLSHSFGRPGASRLQITVAWAWISVDDGEDAIAPPAGQKTKDDLFYKVYTAIDRQLVVHEAPSSSSAISSELERYDRELNGHYIVSGWAVSAAGLQGTVPVDENLFYISAGTINVWGIKRDLPYVLPLRVLEEPDLYTILSEPHVTQSGSETLSFRNADVREVIGVRHREETQRSISRGPAAGGLDTLPDASVTSIVEVSQGATVYVAGIDYVQNGDAIDWSPGGDEPSPGSTYDVTYQYYIVGPPTAWDDTTFSIEGAVPGSEVVVDYKYALPRVDSIVVNKDGEVRYVTGQSVRSNPWAPQVPQQEFRIANVVNNWGGTPQIKNVGTRAVHNVELDYLIDEVQEVRDLVAELRLQSEINRRQPVTMRDQFVDPLRNDLMRDQGLPQTGAIVDETLRLPGTPTVAVIEIGLDPITMDYTEEVIVNQALRTGNERINPYDAFDPLPSSMTIRPPVDTWVEPVTTWASAMTEQITFGAGLASETTVTESTQNLGTQASVATQMRRLQIEFSIRNFYAGERLSSLTFAGVAIPVRASGTVGAAASDAPGAELIADANGDIVGYFDVPPNMATGAVLIEARGEAGSVAQAIYTSTGEIHTTTLRHVTTVRTELFDPQAQSYSLDVPRQITSIDFWLGKIGDPNNNIIVEDRAMENGYPAPGLFGQAEVVVAGLPENSWQRARYPAPVFNDAIEQRALVLMSDDAIHECGIAEIGKLHIGEGQQVGVTEQPYQVGVRFSSGNNRTWTAHQKSDLTFRINAARYTETFKTVPVGTVSLVDCSDLIVYVPVEEPTVDTVVMVKVTRATGEVLRFRPGQPHVFDEYVNEDVVIELELTGTETMSPIVDPYVTIVQGKVEASGDYISRAMKAVEPDAVPVNLVTSFEALLPTGSALTVETGGDGDWTQSTLETSLNVGDGWALMDFKEEGITDAETRIRITLTGTPAARPAIRKLRANTTPDPVNIITGV